MMAADPLHAHAGFDAAAIRRRAFLYQDGVVLAATLRAFETLGLLDGAEGSIAVLFPGLPETGFAHLRVGLRTLAQVGWLAGTPGMRPEKAQLEWTGAGRAMLADASLHTALGAWLAMFDSPAPHAWARDWSAEQAAAFDALRQRLLQRSDDPLAAERLDGALLTPLLLTLDARGVLGEERPMLADFAGAQAALAERGWITSAGQWTEAGRASRRIVPHLGLSGSYLPLLAALPILYRGEQPPDSGPREWHVQRELNIRASSAAHGRYFDDADPIVRSVFAGPCEQWPALVLDTGCGDGDWLARVSRLLPEGHGVRLVGADHAPAALDRARVALAETGVDALLVQGDVGDPDALAATLAGHGLDMADALHLHSFIDHDRGFCSGDPASPTLSTGTFIGPDGEALAPGAVADDLARHLARWAPYARRHGLVTLEAHCVPPESAATQQGALHSVAFDAYHGYSRQYPIEHGAYREAVRRAGLRPAASGGRTYPLTRPFVAVSLNHLRSDAPVPPIDATRLGDNEDGTALHRLLYQDGDIAHPRGWCAPPTQALVTRTLALLRARAASGARLRVCDYGTGTGLATIELLKACREQGLETPIELVCLDLPSPWFGAGQALLGELPDVGFRTLTDETGRFRPLAEIVEPGSVDVMLASMVFHLIRPAALARLAGQVVEVLRPGGTLLWNAPDIGPAADGAALFHDGNRLLRAHWEALLDGREVPQSAVEREALAQAPRDAADRPVNLAERAGRRIFAEANALPDVAAAFAASLDGSVATAMHEITRAELADILRVPSNHREFLPEIESNALRLAFVDEVMAQRILPVLCIGTGVAVQWAHGEYRRR